VAFFGFFSAFLGSQFQVNLPFQFGSDRDFLGIDWNRCYFNSIRDFEVRIRNFVKLERTFLRNFIF